MLAVKLKGRPSEIMKSLADWAQGLSEKEKREVREALRMQANLPRVN
jgi:hypothetical protein